MTFILTPRFAPNVQASPCSPFAFCAPASRPTYGYRVSRPRPCRPAYSSFNHFFSEVDELLGDIEREAQRQAQLEAHIEAQREAHRQRQARKRALRANFSVSQNEQGWQVDGDIQGFNQENINIEVTDENTLRIVGNTRWEPAQPEAEQSTATEPTPAIEQSTEEPTNDQMDGVTLNDAEAAAPADHDSDTESHRSYQATVEDDFEDLGAETSSLVSASTTSSTVADEPTEPKGKERATEATEEPQSEPQTQAPQEQPQEEERVHGSFERTLRFPARIDAANVTASFEGGALRITVPKAQVQQARRIAIL